MKSIFRTDCLSPLLFVFTLFLAVFAPFFVQGAGLTVQPIKISHTINPGESVSGVITVSNAGGKDARIDLKIEDFVPSAGGEGVQFVGRAPGITTARDWIQFGDGESFTFGPGGKKGISYTITAPKDAEPGSHFAVLFFKASEVQEEGSLKIGTQVGVLVFITVPGDFRQEGKILGISAPRFVQKGPVSFKIKFENTGTVHFEPKGTLKVANIFGKEVAEVPISGQAVLPTGARDIAAVWEPEGFILGRYLAKAELFDGEGNSLVTKTVAVWAFPLWYIISFIVAVAALFFVFKYLFSKIRFSISIKKQ